MIPQPGATPAITLDDVHKVYIRARCRDQTPTRLLDYEFTMVQNRLHGLRNPANGINSFDAGAALMKLCDADLQKSAAFFARWADMPAAELGNELNKLQQAALPPPTLEQTAHDTVIGMESRGFRFELQHKTFRVLPASKLLAGEKAALASHKAFIVAELTRRADAWSPP